MGKKWSTIRSSDGKSVAVPRDIFENYELAKQKEEAKGKQLTYDSYLAKAAGEEDAYKPLGNKDVWDEEDIKELQKMYILGYSLVEISESLQRTEKSVVDMSKKLELTELVRPSRQSDKETNKRSFSHWTDDRIKQLTKLWDSGLSYKEIAAKMGLSENNVHKRIELIRKENPEICKTRNRVWSKEEVEKLIELRKMGRPCKSIAEELNRDVTQVYTKIRTMKQSGGKTNEDLQKC